MSEEAEWDTSKENFVPVRQGRPTSALVTPLSVRKRDQELEEAKSAFVAEIRAADDPLPAWLKYIKWTQDQYSTQASRKELTQVLEAATKALSGLKRYNDDVRLLRLWVQYADCLPDPSSVFLFLEDHNIGRDHALFYEAYAAYLELKGSFSQADLVYQEGLKRLAKPLDRLKQKYAAFNQRMAKRRERQETEAALGMGSSASDPAAMRSTLAPLVPLDSTPQLDENGRPIQQPRAQGRNPLAPPQAASVALGVRPAPLAAPSSSRNGRSTAGVPAGAASLWAPASSSSSSSGAGSQRSNALLLSSLGMPGASSSSSNAVPRQLDVHVDEEFGPAGRGAIPTAFPPSLQQHAQLPGHAVATKENSSQPGIWAGTKLKQQGLHVSGPVSNKLEVFEDEESDEGDGEPAAAAAEQPPPAGLRQRLDAPLPPAAAAAAGSDAGIRSNRPAAAFDAAGLDQQQQRPPAAAPLPPQHAGVVDKHAAGSSTSRHSSSSSSSSSGKVVAQAPAAAAAGPPQGFSEALLVGSDGQEQSFEEVRAAAWRRANATKQQQQQQQRESEVAAASARAVSPAGAAEAVPPAPAAAVHAAISKRPAASSSRRPFGAAAPVQEEASVQGQENKLVAAAAGPAAPPAAASGGAAATGGRAAHAGRSAAQDSYRLPGCAAADQGVSAAVVQPAPAAAVGTVAAHDDGGVTMNTRAAFDAMNAMFGGGDDTTAMHGFGRPATAGQRSNAAADAGGVTMNTRAAFEAMNGMFGGGDDTTVHGFGRPAAAAAAGRRSIAAADVGGVTMNTRAAFDAMNGMFGGGDDTTTMHGFGRPAAAGAAAAGRRSIAAADAGGVTMNTRAAFDAMNGMFGGDDTTTMHGFGRAAAAAGVGMEPTVTVNTRAAFDYMNGVFGGPGDVTMGQTAAIAGRKGARKTSRLSMMPPAAAVGSSSGPAGGSLGIYEDTELINPMSSAAQNPSFTDQGPAFGVYEDTEFVGAKLAAAAAGGSSGRGGSDGPGGSNSFGLYEDTDFITRPVGNAGSSGGSRQSMAGGGGGMGLYEDTDFITRHVGNAAGSGSGSSRSGGRQSMAAPAAGLGLYEDTDFITRPVGDSRGSMGAAAAPGSSGDGGGSNGLSLYEDTEFITRPVGQAAAAAAAGSSSHGEAGAGLGLYEDTEFITTTRTVPPAAAGATGSGSGSSTMLLSKLNRLSLANEALYKGQQGGQRPGLRGCRDDENAAPAAAPLSSSLGLYEDTEFIGDAARPSSNSVSGSCMAAGFEVCEDTEFLTKPVSAAAAAAVASAQHYDSGRPGPSSSACDENAGDGRHRHHQQQQQQLEARLQGLTAARPSSVGPLASLGSSGSPGSSSSILQQHPHGYSGRGPSRFGPGSVPNSPGASRPGSAATTPGRPPRTPGTPGTGMGPLARHEDSFEVMESPAVREALAGRPQQPGTAGSSPAGSLAASPAGFGARENVPEPALEGKEGQRVLQPRSMADRAARAAALQPISASRAELLGVQMDPHALEDGDDEEYECDQEQQKQQRGVMRQSPGKALRSLHFGRQQDSNGAPAKKT